MDARALDVRVELLRRYVVLAEELSFTRAAGRLHVTQQVLSAQLRQLEAGVGVEMLRRTSRRVELTSAGEAFLTGAKRVLAETDAAVRAAQEAAGRAQLLLGCEIDAQWLLADRLATFRSAHPGIDIVVVYLLDSSALRALAPTRIDAVAVWGTPPPGLGEHSTCLAVENVHVVLREDDPLATGDVVPAGRLEDRTLWMWPPTTGNQAWELLVGHVSAPPRAIATVGDTGGPALELMIRAVQDKGGYTFAPVSYLNRTAPAGITALPLDPLLQIPLTLTWRTDPPPALQTLISDLHSPDRDGVQELAP